MIQLARNDWIQFFKQLSGKLGSNIYAGFQGQSTPQNIAFIRQLQKEMKNDNSLETPLYKLKVAVFDIETTGFYPERGDQIISIGAVKITGPQLHAEETFYSLVQSNFLLADEISALTNIHQEDLHTAPAGEDVLLEFFKFTHSHLLVAHHSKHEQAFMQKMSWDLLRTRFEQRIIDTSFLIRLSKPSLKSLALEDVCMDCKIEIENRHNALGDAIMTARIWSHYLKHAQKMGFMNLREVYEYIAKLR
ncbi:MAG TPA: exonuclease domain-containing protein [Neobacillus sp.]|jgi:DNA polymerase-3 subunit epsilon